MSWTIHFLYLVTLAYAAPLSLAEDYSYCSSYPQEGQSLAL